MPAWWQRPGAVAGAVLIAAALPVWCAGQAHAIEPPAIDPGAVPRDVVAAPDEPMKQRYACPPTGVLPDTDLAAAPAAQAFMNLPALWKAAGRGQGVTVAIVDTGVNPSVRLPRLRGGGDFVADGDGLSDCDPHGTIVASIIGGAPGPADGFSGVAPDVDLISIRQSSQMFTPEYGGGDDHDRRAGSVSSLAKAIVLAADSGARVMNLSVVACIPVLKPVDQTTLGAAVRYAAVEKDVVLVAAAANLSNPDCSQNPDIDATSVNDPRGWNGVVTISTPSWFQPYVLSVTATDANGQPAVDTSNREISLSGPWVGVGAPGLFVEGFNERGELINGTFDAEKGALKPMSGTSFSAAYVSGLAALVRAKFPDLPAAQVISRIVQTAHSPAAVVDNRVGHGVIDPLAALTYDVPEIAPPREHLTAPLGPPPPPAPTDYRPIIVATAGSAALVAVMGAVFGIAALSKKKGRQ